MSAPVLAPDAITRFEGELRRYVARRVPGPDADDVVQDALLRIHLGVGALRSQARLGPWVYRVARSAILDHHRRRRDLPVAEPEPLPADDDEDVAGASREALSGCIHPFLAALPPDQAEALRLTDLGTLTQAEAAARLGIPLPTLKARVQRGRRALRAVFEACCSFDQDPRGGVVAWRSRCAPTRSPSSRSTSPASRPPGGCGAGTRW